MQTIYVGESKNGRIKLTSDRDCLSADIVRLDERVFADDKHILDAAEALAKRGFVVCVDTDTVFCEVSPYFASNGSIQGTITI
jgi:hypothetical protein